MSGALSCSSPTGQAAPRLVASRFDRGEGRPTVANILDEMDADEAWRPALAAYYKARGMWMSSEILATGIPLTVPDRHEIDCLRTAFQVAPR